MAKNNIVVSMLLNNTDFVKKMNMSWKETKQFEKRMNSATGSLKQMAMGGLAPVLGKLTAFGGAAALAGGAMARSQEKAMALDTALAEMKALLGASAEQMDRFKAAAINMASGSTTAADEVVRAMIKVGGAMPQLLGFEEGLKGVTQSAITLSEASGMTLDESINSLTSMMNQFGASAIDSERYINTLAAASQAGSAEIDYLATAVAKAGGAATSADMEFEELVALIEAVAPKFGKAEEAGTALRGVLLKMETSGNDTKISTQGLAKAIDKLAKMKPEELVKRFGVEGFNMAKAMVDAKDAFAKFNEEVRGTSAAQEQAQIRTDNLKGAIDLLANKWDAFTLSINNSCGPLKDFVVMLGDALDLLTSLNPTYDEWLAKERGHMSKKARTDAAAQLEKNKAAGMTEEEAINAAIAATIKKRDGAQNLQKMFGKRAPGEGEEKKSAFDWIKTITQQMTISGQAANLVDWLKGRAKNQEKISNLDIRDRIDLNLGYQNEQLAWLMDKKNSLKKVVTNGGGGGGGDSTTHDPLEAVRADLKAAGFDTKAIEEAIANTALLEQKIKELDTAIAANANNPEVQQGLIKLQDSYKTLLGTVKAAEAPSTTTIAGLDVTDLAKTRDRVHELEGQIKELEDLLQFDSGNAKLVAKIKELKAELAKLKPEIKEITKSGNLPTYTNPWKKNYQDNWQNGNGHQQVGFVADAAGTAANGMSSMGSLLGRIPGLEEAGEAIGNVTGAIMEVISVIQAVSAIIEMVQGVSAAKEIAASATNTAALVANTAALGAVVGALAANTTSNFIPHFSEGGIIGGHSWTGDKLLARVNSGELVLNAKQQRNLLAGLNNASSGTESGIVSTTKIKGEDLYVSLSNHLKRTGKKF